MNTIQENVLSRVVNQQAAQRTLQVNLQAPQRALQVNRLQLIREVHSVPPLPLLSRKMSASTVSLLELREP